MVRTYGQALVAGVTLSVCTLLGAASLEAAVKDVQLIEAVKQNDVAAVRALIAKKAAENATETAGTTALHWAAHLNGAPIADLLIKAGANVKAATRDGATPFSLACYKGNAEVIMALLAAGEDAKAVFAGEPALMMVARAGNPLAVRAMLGAGAGIVAMDAREQGWDRNGSFKDLQSRNKNPVQAPQGVNADLFIKTLVNEIFTTGEAVAETARRQRAPDAIDPAFWKDYPVYVGRIVRDNCVLEFNRQVARRANTK